MSERHVADLGLRFLMCMRAILPAEKIHFASFDSPDAFAALRAFAAENTACNPAAPASLVVKAANCTSFEVRGTHARVLVNTPASHVVRATLIAITFALVVTALLIMCRRG